MTNETLRQAREALAEYYKDDAPVMVLIDSELAQAEQAKGREAVKTHPMSISKLAAAIDEETRYAYSEIQRLIKTINYMVGIAERGRGFDCPANESPEKFLLDYVKYLEKSQAETKTPEAQPAERVALTDEQIIQVMCDCPVRKNDWADLIDFARAIEAKLREKNAGQPVASEPSSGLATIDKIMEQAQVFASAWSLVGGRFDAGVALDDAQEAKAELRSMICALLSSDAKPASEPNFADAYQGAMEDVSIWKRRAMEAEELNRRFIAEINGPMYMGEPVAVPQGYPCEIEEADFEANTITVKMLTNDYRIHAGEYRLSASPSPAPVGIKKENQ